MQHPVSRHASSLHAPSLHAPSLHAPSLHAHDRLRRILKFLGIVLAVLLLIGTVTVLHFRREAALDSAQARARAAAQLLSQHVLRVFYTTEFLIDQAAEKFSTPPDQAATDIMSQFRDIAGHLPESGHLFLTDAQGKLILSTRSNGRPGLDLSKRLFYTALRDDPARSLVVGPLVKTYSGEIAFHMARRLTDAQGQFAGVAAASINGDALSHFHESLDLGQKGAITILDRQGRTILRHPMPDPWDDQPKVSAQELEQAIQASRQGRFRHISPFDGLERLIAFESVEPYGAVVAVSITVEDGLAEWRRSLYWIALLAGVGTLLLVWLMGLVFATLKREEELVHGLEETVHLRTREAEQQAEEARRANASKTRFLAATSHDLRQPLQAAGMFVEVLAVRLEDSPHLAVVDKLRQSVEATQSLMNTLLDATSLEAGRVKPQWADFPLAGLMVGLAEQLEPQASQAGLRVRVVPCRQTVHSDPALLERILRNLLVNAVRYTGQGSVLLGCRRRGDQVEICVYDTGPGLDSEQIGTIFEDFTRLDNAPRPVSRGLGLGLGIVRRTAELLGHEVEVRSWPGKGSCFLIRVPRTPPVPTDGADSAADGL